MDIAKNSKNNTNKISALSIVPRRHKLNGKGQQVNKIEEKNVYGK